MDKIYNNKKNKNNSPPVILNIRTLHKKLTSRFISAQLNKMKIKI